MTETTVVTQDDLNHTINIVNEIVQDFATRLENALNELARRVEAGEKVSAVLALSFAESASLLDGLFDHIISKLSDEEKEVLETHIQQCRKQMLETLDGKNAVDG